MRYLGDLVLRHDAAAYTWSCSVRLAGTLEIFLVFCSGRGIVGGKGAIALTIRTIGAIEIKTRGFTTAVCSLDEVLVVAARGYVNNCKMTSPGLDISIIVEGAIEISGTYRATFDFISLSPVSSLFSPSSLPTFPSYHSLHPLHHHHSRSSLHSIQLVNPTLIALFTLYHRSPGSAGRITKEDFP